LDNKYWKQKVNNTFKPGARERYEKNEERLNQSKRKKPDKNEEAEPAAKEE